MAEEINNKEQPIVTVTKLRNYLTITEAAHLRNITESCLRKRIKQGQIPVVKKGKNGYLIRYDDLDKIALGKRSGRPRGSKNNQSKEEI